MADVRAATRALNEALGALTRSVTEASVRTSQKAVGASVRASQKAVEASLRRAAEDLDAASRQVSTFPRRRTTARGEASRERLLAAARTVFAAKGYEGASVNDIAAEAGFTKGAFYAAFPSKAALFVEIAVGRPCPGPAEPGPLDRSFDLGSLSPEEVLLQLEICLYAVRHPESREVIAAAWQRSLDDVGTGIARRRGRAAPTDKDRHDAFAAIATTLLGAVVNKADGAERTNALVAGALERILGEEPGG